MQSLAASNMQYYTYTETIQTNTNAFNDFIAQVLISNKHFDTETHSRVIYKNCNHPPTHQLAGVSGKDQRDFVVYSS